MDGKILIIGFGPGSYKHITVREAIQESQVIIGYNTYVDLIRDLLTNQDIVRTGMTEEVSRAQKAVDLATEGKVVAVISSGDAVTDSSHRCGPSGFANRSDAQRSLRS